MGAHDGHRKRLKDRFLQEGAEGMHDHELLELLLFYAIPRRDTNLTAHALLQRFGTLQGVLDAPTEALEAVDGVGAHAAALLKTVAAVQTRLTTSGAATATILKTSADAAAFLTPRFRDADSERVYLLCLDGRKRVTCCEELARGTLSQVEVSVRQVVEIALRNQARGVLLCHNHPNAPSTPSREDELVTLQIGRALGTIGITLVDHIILSETEYTSMADSGILINVRKPYQSHTL